jgi:hypothetical protein
MPYSTYSKIYDLLSVLDQIGSKDIFELASEIYGRGIESFAIWRRSEGSERPVKGYCSEASIRRLIRFVCLLQLIDMENARICRINQIGKNALTGDNYSTQLSAQVKTYMREVVGLAFEDLSAHIDTLKVPDARTIYLTLIVPRKLGISEEDFRRLLYLLQRCGELAGVIRKIYSTTGA